MVLDRDELAARCLVALLSRGGYVGDAEAQRLGAVVAVGCADALLSALVPVAPASGAPVAAPSRPEEPVKGDSPRSEWVRITGPENAACVTVGRAYRVIGWHDMDCGGPIITSDLGERWRCYAKASDDGYMPTWEPCAAPSPSPEPAATPAAYVPKVGDVVGIDSGNDYGETRVVTAVGARVTYARLNYAGKMLCDHTMDVSRLTYLRAATASERAAAGLPVDESATECDEDAERKAAWTRWKMAENDGFKSGDWNPYLAGWLARARLAAPTSKPVDRVALADALHIAWWWREKTTATPWGEIHPDSQADWLRAADAAIAFLNGGAS